MEISELETYVCLKAERIEEMLGTTFNRHEWVEVRALIRETFLDGQTMATENRLRIPPSEEGKYATKDWLLSPFRNRSDD